MPMLLEEITEAQAERIRLTEEGQFSDVKGTLITPAKLTKTISAFANSDGGDLYIGIYEETQPPIVRTWAGFANQEAANGHLQALESLFPLGTDFGYTFLKCNARPGLVLHVHVNRTRGIMQASNGIYYIRRGAQNLPQDTPELIKRLEYAKGVTSFESEPINASKETVTESEVIKGFIQDVVPTTTPEKYLRNQALLSGDRPTVACALLFSDEPQALMPKRCGVKVYRYKTTAPEGFREALAFTPKTVEGCLYNQIKDSVKLTTEIVEAIPKMGEGALEKINYPPEALHEIIANALIHRDYSMSDDVHITVFDNRIEIKSPGRLPAHITVKNILDERAPRNGALVRLLNKFPDPPNKDVGEGLNTAFAAMTKLGLKEPVIIEKENNVVVIIRHESLASPEEAIMDYLESHPTINNKKARQITYIAQDYRVKTIFGKMVEKHLIEQVPGTKTGGICYRKYRG